MRRLMAKRKFSARVYRSRGILKSTVILIALGLFIRMLPLLGISEKTENLLREAAADDIFIETALNMELGGAKVLSVFRINGWQSIITGESAVMAAGFRGGAADTVPGNSGGGYIASPGEENTPMPSPSPASPTYDPDFSQPVPITINPTSPNGYDYAGGVYIKNETDFKISVEDYINAKPALSLNKDSAQVLIVHSHGSEAFFPDEEFFYVPTDNNRTEDKNFNVVRLGDEIAKIFGEKGIKVIHERGIYDYPTYSGSYTRTLEVIEKRLKENPGIKVVLDIHRDSLVTDSGITYKTVTEIDGKSTAQIMLVLGTSQGGLEHPDWKENLKLGVQVQKALSDKYPTFMRPLNLRKERFNMHATKGSMLVEIGCSGNTLGEAINAARIFADVTADVLNRYVK